MFELEKERADAKIRVARDIISNPTDLRFLGDIERDADHAGWWGTEASLIYLMEGQPPTRRAKMWQTSAKRSTTCRQPEARAKPTSTG